MGREMNYWKKSMGIIMMFITNMAQMSIPLCEYNNQIHKIYEIFLQILNFEKNK